MTDRKSFVFYTSWKDSIKDLPDSIRLEIYESLIEYAATGEIGELSPMAKIAFNFIKSGIDSDTEKYNKVVERNKENIRKRWEKDKSDEIPDDTKNTTGKTGIPKIPDDTKNTDNDNDNDNDNDISSSKDSDIEKESTSVLKKETSVSSPAPPQSDFEKYNEWIKEKAPYCANPKNLKQLTEAEFRRLKSLYKYTGKQIADIIEQIENRKDLRKRYSNLYKTVLNWAKKEYGSEPNDGKPAVID